MILLDLFVSFLKIGFTSFGGLSMIPLITQEMSSHHWMTASEISDIVAIAEMTPGPLGMNCATFAGLRTAGIPGAIMSNLGVMMPTMTLCCAAAVFFEKFRKSSFMEKILTGIRPVCIGLIVAIMVTLSMSNYSVAGNISLPLIGIALLDMFLLLKFKLGVPAVIMLSAGMGLLLMQGLSA